MTKRNDILWLIILRLIVVTSLLISAVLIQYSATVFLLLEPFYFLVLITYALSIGYFIFYILNKNYTAQGYVQILLDLVIITILVYISGGLRGSFYFLYIFIIIAASIILSSKAAILTASLSAVCFGVLVDGLYFELIPYYGAESMEELSLGPVLINIFMAWGVFFIVAFLTNYLTEKLRKTREELVLAQRELEYKKRLAIAGEVAAQLAHEIRNPLAAISGSVQVLKEELDFSEEQMSLMELVVKESQRVSHSIESFLSVSSPGTEVQEWVDLSTAMDETLTLMKRSGELDERYSVQGNYISSDLRLYGNADQFKQVFWNIMKNAKKAMPEGGTLSVDFSKNSDDEIELRFADTGIGMSEKEKKRLFDPFYSKFQSGNGIGMMVVQRIVDTYEGSIQVFSEVDKGTEVVITLPQAHESE
jgi:signal transduction histidine kinase